MVNAIPVRVKFGAGLDWESFGAFREDGGVFTVLEDCTADEIKEHLSTICHGTLRPEHLRLRLQGNAEELQDYAACQPSTSTYQPPRITLATQGVRAGSVLELDVILSEEDKARLGLLGDEGGAGVGPEALGHDGAAQAATGQPGADAAMRVSPPVHRVTEEEREEEEGEEEQEATLGLATHGRRKRPEDGREPYVGRASPEAAARAATERRTSPAHPPSSGARLAIDTAASRAEARQPSPRQEEPNAPAGTGAYGTGADAADAAAPATEGRGRAESSPLPEATGHWTVRQVEEFANAIEKYGLQWSVLEKETQLRSQKDLRYKWRNLVSAIKANWVGTRGLPLPKALRDRLTALHREHGAKQGKG